MTYENTADSMFQLIEEIAATSGKKDKEMLVGQLLSFPLGAKIVTYAYHPFKVYRMEAVPARVSSGPNTLDEQAFWDMLDEMETGRLSGQAAIDEVQTAVNSLNAASAELLARIIRKNLRAGFSEDTCNRVKPGFFPDFPYMRCSLPPKSNMDKWDWSVGIISQEKADGMFANVNRDADGKVWITSRSGTMFPKGSMPELENFISKGMSGAIQMHGELLVFQDDTVLPREKSNGMLNSLTSGGSLEPGYQVCFYAWDSIPLAEVKTKGKVVLGYKHRLTNLIQNVRAASLDIYGNSVRIIPTRVVKSKAEAMQHYRELLAVGKEGTILKHPQAPWEDKTSKDQVKLKLEVDVDLRAKEIVPGRVGTKNEGRPGSVKCVSECGKLVVDVTIKNEAMRDAVEKDPHTILERIFAVRANSVMAPSESSEVYSLFLPRFVEDQPRIDKHAADDLAQVQAQFEAAVQG